MRRLGFALVFGVAGCGADSPRCITGQVVACPGPGACSGSQTCQANGTYGACTCGGGTAGAGGSGLGMDAGAGSGGGAGVGGSTGGGGAAGGAAGGSESDAGGVDGPTISCDPVSQAPCGADQRCAWITTGPNGAGHSACRADGTVSAGGACTVLLSGIDSCRRGTACVYGTCKTLCGLSPDTCTSGWACGNYVEVPFNPDGFGSTGYCDPTCDPITQARDFDRAPNCGSVSAQDPELGCYGVPNFPFTCGPAGDPAKRFGAVPQLAPDRRPYQNGCAPGFLPMFYSGTSNMEWICAATCEPGPTSSQSPANAQGRAGSAYTCPAKGAPAGHECRYWWWLEDSDAANFPTPLGNTLGFCIDYASYRWDRDGNGTLEAPYPSCTSLSNTAYSYVNDWTDDVVWGCAPVP
jgi:hypothetical protein